MSEAAMRILFVGVKWPPETFLARLVRGLAERGHQITVALPRPPDAAWRAVDRVDFLLTPGWSGSRTSRLARTAYEAGAATLRSPRAAAQTVAEARGSGRAMTLTEQSYRWLPYAGRTWDVIYFPWNATAVSHLPLMARAPSVISCRGTQINVAPHNPERTELRLGLPESFAKAAAVHCVSEAICREATLYGLDPAKSVVIRPAVDPAIFCPAPQRRPPDGTLRVIMTGSVIWRKGYEHALSAIDRLRARGVPVTLEIIGSGDEEQRLLYTLNDLELTECVQWHGQLPATAVVERLQAADVFLLASVSEGISNALLEAMACGLPVVTTDISGMDEAVTDGVEGLIVPPRDARATAAALEQLAQDAAARRRMGEAGRARVLSDFRLDDQVTEFERLFRSVV
jgi:glycosyltransferase involved in cell wall biosynthesis